MFGIFDSPIGKLVIESDGKFIIGLNFIDDEEYDVCEDDVIKKCKEELSEYFEGNRTIFTVPIKYNCTEFRNKVYGELIKIPYGHTISYKELAERIGNPKAVRAVGGANHHNKISVIIPCHRVIGKDGSLVGYGGGVWRKEWLLNFEKDNL